MQQPLRPHPWPGSQSQGRPGHSLYSPSERSWFCQSASHHGCPAPPQQCAGMSPGDRPGDGHKRMGSFAIWKASRCPCRSSAPHVRVTAARSQLLCTSMYYLSQSDGDHQGIRRSVMCPTAQVPFLPAVLEISWSAHHLNVRPGPCSARAGPFPSHDPYIGPRTCL